MNNRLIVAGFVMVSAILIKQQYTIRQHEQVLITALDVLERHIDSDYQEVVDEMFEDIIADLE